MAWKDKRDPRRLAYRVRWMKRSTRRLKIQVIQGYGGRCECCGESRLGFLCLDHVQGDGARERRLPTGSTNALRRRLRRQGYPRGAYRVLCYNCNMGREYNGGVCPHLLDASQQSSREDEQLLSPRPKQLSQSPPQTSFKQARPLTIPLADLRSASKSRVRELRAQARNYSKEQVASWLALSAYRRERARTGMSD